MEERLLNILKIHRGKERAITAKELSRQLDMDDRFIRTKIRGFIADGIPIASIVQKPYGYYIVETLDEANDYMQSLRNRLIEDALRRRDFKRAIAKSFNGSGQLKMF